MIKPRILVLFMLLTGMEGLGLLLILANTPSAAENTVLWGLSVPRLVLAAILLFGSLVAFGLGLAAWLITPLGRRTAGWLDCAASRPEQLLAVSFFLLVGVFAAPGMVGVSLTLGWTRIFERVAPLLAWISLACGQALGILALSYSSAFQLPGFFHNAPVKIIRGSFLGRIETWAVLSVLIVAGCVLGVSSPASSGLVVSHDSGIFLYFGQEILNGQIPFRDLWDHKPPLIFYLDALGLFLGRGSLWGVWFLEFLALVSSALMAFSTLRRFYRSLPAILAATGMLASSIFLLEGGNLTEEFALPLQWGALFLFARWRGSNRDRGWDPIALATGVLFGLAFSLKQTMIGVWVSLYLYLGLRLPASAT
jgi:hypothetical protein